MSKENRDARKLVFIVGSPRSGTTWLQMLLSRSPYISMTPETHLFNRYLRSMFQSMRELRDHNYGLSNLLPDEEILDWVRQFAELCFDRIADSKPSSRIVVEKTPMHSAFAGDILRVFPNSYFIHMIRDPRSVVASVQAASRTWAWRWTSGSTRDACAMWKSRVGEAKEIAALTPRYREVYYERMHANGAGEVAELFEWIGEPVDLDTAHQYIADSTLQNLRAIPLAPSKVPGPAPEDFYRRGEVDSWQWELSSTEIAIVERLTKKHMAHFAYAPVSGRRARLAAKAHLRAYKSSARLERVAHRLREWLKP